jgi:hypothetical protein
LGALAALVLAATPCGAVAADDGAIRVTVGTTELIDESADLSADWYLNALEARFGIRFDIYSSNADIDGLTDLWIQSGDIPDVLRAASTSASTAIRRQGLWAFSRRWKQIIPTCTRTSRRPDTGRCSWMKDVRGAAVFMSR